MSSRRPGLGARRDRAARVRRPAARDGACSRIPPSSRSRARRTGSSRGGSPRRWRVPPTPTVRCSGWCGSWRRCGRRPELRRAVVAGPGARRVARRDRMLRVLGASTALTDHLVAHPEQWTAVTAAEPPGAGRAPYRARRGGRRPRAAGARRRAAGRLPRAAARHRCPRPRRATRSRPCPGRPRRSPTSPTPRSRRPWPSPAAEVGEAAARTRLAVIAMGKTGGRELNYVSRRRRHLRRRARRGGARGRGGRGRHRPGHPADAAVLGLDRGRLAVAGRPGAAPRGQGGTARAHRGQPPLVLRALGQDLGVPGPAQGPPRRRRHRGGPGVLRRRAADGLAGLHPRELRRRRPGDAAPRRAAHPAGRGRAPAQAGPRGPARRRVLGAAAPARARAGRRDAADREHARRRWPRSPPAATSAATTPRPSPRPTATCARSSTASSCTACAAPT